jgi:hypothetical protein
VSSLARQVLVAFAATVALGMGLLVAFEPEVQTVSAVDATENALLLSATGSPSEGAVDAAHALEVPKVSLFLAGAALAVVVNLRAAKALRAGD